MSKVMKNTNRSDSPSTDSSSLADSAGTIDRHEITNGSEIGTIYQYSLPSMAKTPPRLVTQSTNEVPSTTTQSIMTMKTYPRLPSIEPIYAGDSCIIDCISTEPTVKRSVAVPSVQPSSRIENSNRSKSGCLVVLILFLLLVVIISQVGIMYLLKYDNDNIRKELDIEIAKSSTCQLRCHNQLADYKKYLKHICHQKSSRKNQAIVDVLMQSNW